MSKQQETGEIKLCDGCGSTKTMAEVHAMGGISCCPERKMLSIKEWSDRAIAAEARLAEAVKALRLARQRIEYLGISSSDRHMAANEKTFFPAIDEALAAAEGITTFVGGSGK